MNDIMNAAFFVALLSAALRLSVPILFAALGGMFSERSGVVNIGLEGIMLTGAFAGVVGSYFTGSQWLGALVAMLSGVALAALFALITVKIQINQIVSGIAINLLAVGLTSFFFRALFGITTTPITVNAFAPVSLPGLSTLPFVGEILFSQTALVYIAFLLVPVSWFILYKTSWGLNIRTVGEHPTAADTVGIPVNRVRTLCVLASGALAGLGGAFLSLGQFNMFVDNMISGRGFIAVAAVIFGRWNPKGILIASLIFGVADALQIRLQTAGVEIPYQFLLMFPYLLTVVALTGIVGKTVAPKALGKAYAK
ncbi:ABC transporter permease [Acidaminobacter hydrogenoformans]|uniref:Nucleoside ABC transporter membrane protein n=1 Tax=Acidaminobacter hydrogenoformans DSM 2784 TaxID=1120920 RepID=A0A1G5RQU9_9FIRM|nr:ABC transporter permease [Acidaminobacter hydrogenoformans]SCZ76228.1 nucleoside ABC transporter membrane protein [Acidaminobacter hydrogenoformans DSM 2784]